VAIDSKHPDYQANLDLWNRCRDTYEGEDAVKARGTLYLPKADPLQTHAEYQSYLTRAAFFEAVGRTIDGFVGALSRRPHIIQLPPAIEELEDDVTADGVSLRQFIKLMCREVLLTARGGVLVDFDEKKGRPFLQFYPAEAVINWSDTSIVLAETVYEPDPEEQFANKAIDQLRQVEFGPDGYTVTLWRKTQAAVTVQAEWAIYDRPRQPTKQGVRLDRLPWWWLSTMGATARVERPPLLGLVNTSLSHYRNSADLEHGRHFAGMPTLWVAGITSDQPIRVGAATAILLSDPHAKVAYAEFVGQGLGSLERALEMKERQMAVLGAAAFSEQKKAFESAEAIRLRQGGENSLLTGTVGAVETAIADALRFAAAWAGGGDATLQVALNRDFVEVTLDGQKLQALVAAYQAGAITLESFLYDLQQAELMPPETDIAGQAAQLRAEAVEKANQEAALAQKATPQPAGPAG
jgi:hypothetical protein